MKIEIGVLEDIDSIMTLLKSVIKDMESQKINQWNEFYPTAETFENDILKQSLFLIRAEENDEEGLVGMIAFDEIQPSEYSQMDWLSKNEPALVIHRLAVNPKYQGKGFARKLMDFAEDYGRNHGYKAVRLDAYTGNARTLSFYEKNGYKKTGEILFPWRELPFNCYEKIL